MNEEIILELQKALEELLVKPKTKSYVETECDCTTGCCSNEPCDASNKYVITPIEDCITTFINKCTAEGRLPTLEEAHSIKILDETNSKYN